MSAKEVPAGGEALSGRSAIITGAASGLGREYALLFAAEGARLVLADIASPRRTQGRDSLETVQDEVRALGGEAVLHRGDIGEEATADALVALAHESYGGLDVLINNAGNWYEGELIDSDVDAWDSIVRTHLRGPFLTTRAAGRHWREVHRSGRPVAGSVINTSSRSALSAIPTHGVYGSAKAGVVTLTHIAAKELAAFGVRVNCVVPAARTPMAEQVSAMRGQLEQPAVDFDPLAPENVAPLVAYLAAEDCPLTGQVLFCRGGTIESYDAWTSRPTLAKDGRWTIAELAQQLPATFTP